MFHNRYSIKCLALQWFAIGSFCLLIGCRESPPQARENSEEDLLDILTVNEPLRYMGSRLTDSSWAKVTFPAPPETVDPSTWTPDGHTIQRYQKADMILLNGAHYAQWIEQAALPITRLFNTTEAYKERWIQRSSVTTHQHGPEGEHEHGIYAPMTWLDFQLAADQATSIAKILSDRWPDHAAKIQAQLVSLRADLLQLHHSMLPIATKLDGIPLLASHPVYEYLAKAYRLDLRAMHWEPEELPPPDQWEALDALLKQHPSHVMLWEDTPIQSITQQLEERGVQVVVFRPQGGPTQHKDFLEVMQDNLKSLEDIQAR